MKLFTKSIFDRLVKNHKEQDGTKSFKVVVKLFNPIGNETWYLSELNPETNVAFGLCYITDKEYGYVDLNELEKFKGALGLGIERDKFFTPKTLEECKNL